MVCNYLKYVQNNRIQTDDLIFSPPEQRNIEVLSSTECATLLEDFFEAKNLSFSVLNIFLNFFSAQLIKFGKSQYFTVANLMSMGCEGRLRKDVVLAILKVSEDFSHRSAGVVSRSQVSKYF